MTSSTFLLFDFGTNEEAVQQARHKLEGWKQAFRLDKKMLFKFEREELPAAEPGAAEKSKGKPKAKAKPKETEAPAGRVKLVIRLHFSDHEKLSRQRWVERIPSEEPFKDAAPHVVHPTDVDFAETAKRFDELPGGGAGFPLGASDSI